MKPTCSQCALFSRFLYRGEPIKMGKCLADTGKFAGKTRFEDQGCKLKYQEKGRV